MTNSCYNQPTMEWIIGTESPKKIETAKRVIAQVTQSTDFCLTGFNADSKVGNTPYDKDTFEGASNRAAAAQTAYPKADYWIGLESGLVQRYEHLFEEAWACVIDNNNRAYYGFSSGLKVPDIVLTRMKENSLEHWQAMIELRKELGMDTIKDTWGNYTGNKLLRDISLEEALRNALMQALPPKESFYALTVASEEAAG